MPSTVCDLIWLETKAMEPALNMAVDEALFLRGLSAIRFYDWACPALSMGYFQSAKNYKETDSVVRRITGGGTVEHGEDLTFSMILDLKFFPSLASVKQSYYRIHYALKEGFQRLGVSANFFSSSKLDHGVFCFRAPSPDDLMFEGRKIAGGAQKRKNNILLHQGSVSIKGLGIKRCDLIKAFLEGFKDVFNLDLKEDSGILSDLEEEIKRLQLKYASRDWTFRY